MLVYISHLFLLDSPPTRTPPSQHFGKVITVAKVDTATPQGTEARIDVVRTLTTSPTGIGLMGTNLMATNLTDTSQMGMGIKATVLDIKVTGNMLREETDITAPVASLVNMNWTA